MTSKVTVSDTYMNSSEKTLAQKGTSIEQSHVLNTHIMCGFSILALSVWN